VRQVQGLIMVYPPGEHAMGMKKVLVCDDSNTDRAHLERIVSATGCVVITTTNGREAIQKAKSEKPDLIFLDIVMPEMDGYATCRALLNDPDTKHIPVVFVTSKGQKADRVWAQMQGGKGLVAKPYSDDEIVKQVTKVA
jgi:twitching motility two-component system response regulator PilH